MKARALLSGRVLVTSLLGSCAAAASIGLMATAAWLVSRAAERPNVAALAVAVVGVRFFGVARGVFRYAERVQGHDAALRRLAEVRGAVVGRLARLAPAGLPAFRSGDLLARLVDDVDRLQDLVLRVLPPYAVALVVGTLTVGLLTWLLPAAGVVLAVALLLAATVVPAWSNRRTRAGEARQAETRGRLSSAVVDLLDGAPDLLAHGADRDLLARAEAVDHRLAGQARTAARTAGTGEALVVLLGGLACWGALLAGVAATRDGRLDSTLLAVVVLTPLAAAELMAGLPPAAATFERVRQSLGRLAEVDEAPDPVTEPELPDALPTGPFTVAAAGVRAGYGGGGDRDRWALDGVDLELAPGRVVAVVGPSGAGKSTLAGLLVRFLDPAGGRLALNGVPYARLSGEQVRAVVGLCEQDGHVFDTTLAGNLALASPDASPADLRRVLAEVGLLDWVDRLPDGLLTRLGEGGRRLSGGQRQRLVVARTLLADFPVLVLDEPAEHLDTDAADRLTATLLRLRADRATLLITHRLTGLAGVDEILLLESGRVVERGSHDSLLAQGGRYARLWRREQDLALSDGHRWEPPPLISSVGDDEIVPAVADARRQAHEPG